jgi:hypothetical protein
VFSCFFQASKPYQTEEYRSPRVIITARLKHARCRKNSQTKSTQGSSIRHKQKIIPHGIAPRHMQKAVPEASIPPRIAAPSGYPRLLSHGCGLRSMSSPTTSFSATTRF